MLFSTLGYALGGQNNNDSDEKIRYNGIEFIQDSSGYWKFILNNYEFFVKHSPEEVKDINFKGNLDLSDLQDNPLYFVGGSQEPTIEIARNLERFVLRIQNACIDGEDCEGDLPIKNCFEDNIIIIKELESGEAGEIYQEGNCVYIGASYADQTKYADKFLYDLLGI